MKKTVVAVGAAVLTLVLAACDVTSGTSCSQEGSKATNKDGSAYTCQTLINPDGTPGKRVWRPDAPLKKDRP